jgi:hypothetical protein
MIILGVILVVSGFLVAILSKGEDLLDLLWMTVGSVFLIALGFRLMGMI